MSRSEYECLLREDAQTNVNLSILKALLQILIDSFVRHLAQQCQVRDSDLLLLGRIECRLLDIGLPSPPCPTAARRRIACGFILWSPTYSLTKQACQKEMPASRPDRSEGAILTIV